MNNRTTEISTNMADTNKTTTAASTTTAAPTTTKAPVKMAKRTIIFRPPYTKKDGSTPNIASADLLGCFGGIMLAVKDFGLRLNADRTITVYMPSGMYRSAHVGPLGGELRTDADVVAEATTMAPDDAKAFIARERNKRANVEMLAQAFRDAWVACKGQLSVPVEIELPE